jgi:hypothetical protein
VGRGNKSNEARSTCCGLALWLTLPTGSDVLVDSKDAAAADPREKTQLSEEATREGTGKKWSKHKRVGKVRQKSVHLLA